MVEGLKREMGRGEGGGGGGGGGGGMGTRPDSHEERNTRKTVARNALLWNLFPGQRYTWLRRMPSPQNICAKPSVRIRRFSRHGSRGKNNQNAGCALSRGRTVVRPGPQEIRGGLLTGPEK